MLFINDGSKDNTIEILNKIAKQNKNTKVLSNSINKGKAESVRLGVLALLKNEKIDTIGYLDADLSTSFEEFINITTILNSQICFVFGSRIQTLNSNIDRKFTRFFIGRIIATMISKTLKLKIYDTQCGCKAFNRRLGEELFKEKFISKWLFDVELFFRLLQLEGRNNIYSVAQEHPLKEWIDVGDSKVKATYFLKLFLDLIKIKKAYRNV